MLQGVAAAACMAKCERDCTDLTWPTVRLAVRRVTASCIILQGLYVSNICASAGCN